MSAIEIAAAREGIETYHGHTGPQGPGLIVLAESHWMVVQRVTLIRESGTCLVSVDYEAKPRHRLARAVDALAPGKAREAFDFAVMYGVGRREPGVGATLTRRQAAALGLLDWPSVAESAHLARLAERAG